MFVTAFRIAGAMTFSSSAVRVEVSVMSTIYGRSKHRSCSTPHSAPDSTPLLPAVLACADIFLPRARSSIGPHT
jgi:hypothetical protein